MRDLYAAQRIDRTRFFAREMQGAYERLTSEKQAWVSDALAQMWSSYDRGGVTAMDATRRRLCAEREAEKRRQA